MSSGYKVQKQYRYACGCGCDDVAMHESKRHAESIKKRGSTIEEVWGISNGNQIVAEAYTPSAARKLVRALDYAGVKL